MARRSTKSPGTSTRRAAKARRRPRKGDGPRAASRAAVRAKRPSPPPKATPRSVSGTRPETRRRTKSGSAAAGAKPRREPAERARGSSPTPRPPPTGRWLVKTEPGTYGYADLEREGRTVWEGVANALARIHLRAMREGDLVLVYHTGAEKAVVGLARVVAGPRAPVPLPPDDQAAVVVDLAAVARAAPAVPADDLREESACRELALFRIPRLSVMPVSLEAFDLIGRKAGFPS